MYMIQISEEKKEKMSEMCEKMLKYGGKLMQCIEDCDERTNLRWDDDDEDYPRSRFGLRRGRMRY